MATDRCLWCPPPCGGNGPAFGLSTYSGHYEVSPSTVNQRGSWLSEEISDVCDGEEPVLSAGRSSERRGTASYTMDGGLCLCVIWDLNIQQQLRRCTICQNVMFSQRKFVMFYSSGVIDTFIKVRLFPRTLFLNNTFRETVWFGMAFYIVGKTDARLPFSPCMKHI